MMEPIVTLVAAVVGITGGALAGRLRPSGVAALCAGGVPAAGVVALFAFC
jgi:hypothetical protein